jgi:Hemolysin-type calcium-binding repeat (2 copies).
MTTATTTSFPNATKPVTVFGGAGEDNFVVGKGSDSITGGSGADVFTIANGSTGITPATADIITDFKTGVDKLKLGLVGDATSNTGNYSENVNSVADFQAALEAANTVLASLNSTSSASELYSFQFDSSYGYLFIDTDSDGVYEDLLLLSGIESSMIASSDIIA